MYVVNIGNLKPMCITEIVILHRQISESGSRNTCFLSHLQLKTSCKSIIIDCELVGPTIKRSCGFLNVHLKNVEGGGTILTAISPEETADKVSIYICFSRPS